MDDHLNKLIITADDFGISLGVNKAVEQAYLSGGLTHASLIANSDYFQQATEIAKKNPDLQVGLHFNLTFGKPLKSNDLAAKNGNFSKSFFGYLLGIKKIDSIKNELIAQIVKLQKAGINISHIDGHHHIHMIPYIFQIVTQVAAEFGIKRIRIINEPFWPSFRASYDVQLFLTGFCKWLLFRLLYQFNGKKSECYFFSILYSCKISKNIMLKFKIPNSYNECEIMLHPGDPNLDKDWIGSELNHLLSKHRLAEFQTATQILSKNRHC